MLESLKAEPRARQASPARRFTPSFGATLVAPDRTLFRFWAPDVARVELEIEGGPAQPMRFEAEGWHSLEAACGARTHYRYRLASGVSVPDPASRAQAAEIGGYSIVVDPDSYQWRNADWR